MSKKRPNGYWQDIENVKRELAPWISLGTLPTRSQLKAAGEPYLLASISQYHGHKRKLAAKLGIDLSRKTCVACRKVLPKSEFRPRTRRLAYGDGARQYDGISNVCRPCEKERNHIYRKYTKRGLAYDICNRARHRAKVGKVACDIDIDWVVATLDAQDWRCALTGHKFSIRPKDGEDRLERVEDDRAQFGYDRKFTISTDRIDATKGYTKDNVRFITQHMNVALQHWGADEFERLAVRFLEKRGFECKKM